MAKQRIDKEAKEIGLRYANWLAQLIAMIKPTNLYVILGRATGKTVSILAYRFKDMSKEMPGAFISISVDTYMNALKNIVPNIIIGWEKLGWIDGIHFVVDKKPPKHFKKPHKTVLNWKHTITTHHGTHFKIVSQDRPSAGAGDSYQADGGDEAKYLKKHKLNKIQQATRGEFVRYKDSPYYGGSTYTTDMPNTNLGEEDWILEMENNVDDEQIRKILSVAFIINEDTIKLVQKELLLKSNPKAIEIKKDIANLKANINRWREKYNALRMGSTFFYVGSSYSNADILTEKYFKQQFEKGNFKELMTALLSLKPKLEKGLMFYPNLSEANFYKDGFNYSRIDKTTFAEFQRDQECSLDLRYIRHEQHLEAGFDSGNMCSLVIGQDQGKILRGLKEFYTLPPEFIKHLGAYFVEYFKYHKRKELLLFHDRATNKWQRVGEDHASKLQDAIQKDENGNATGWTVVLQNRDQGNITQQTEYELMLELMSGDNKDLPMLIIDKDNCPNWKSSMEQAQKYESIDKKGKKSIHKDKSTEKLPDERLLAESTNMSDAGKYFVCRPEYLEKIEGNETYFSGNPSIN
ncbi:hypothetical protein ES692_06160 [Psychroserpens burtonensis]|uniref:Uncharacterized protein n=1 Tax=Psychroserpens burtonensis TaxID=49278 RepID=A0A5C7BGN7_9FLAO|nr:hypothetical protein [Psychroserpens burtonensis]TXE18625.1 hypothetical protein ES692_06160 [Psychroserpens burtonensis]